MQNSFLLLASILFLTLNGCTTVSESKKTASKPFASEHIPSVLKDLTDSSSSKILIAAHRGGYESDKTDKSPENSIANIFNCKNKGYELYETDIQRSKDGHFIIAHDLTIKRETSGSGKVSDMRLSELRGFSKRYRDGNLSHQRIATLAEFLELSEGIMTFKADLKPGVSKHFREIMQLVIKLNALDRIIFRVPYREVDLYAQYRAEKGIYAKHMFMFMVSSKKQIDDIRIRFDSTTIQINLDKSDPSNEEALDLIRYATSKGFLVETHAEGNKSDWTNLTEAGVRIFHTKTPSKMKKFLSTL